MQPRAPLVISCSQALCRCQTAHRWRRAAWALMGLSDARSARSASLTPISCQPSPASATSMPIIHYGIAPTTATLTAATLTAATLTTITLTAATLTTTTLTAATLTAATLTTATITAATLCSGHR